MDDKKEQATAQTNTEVDERQLFNSDSESTHVEADSMSDSTVTWEASEFIHHDKSPSWYLILTGSTVLLGIILYISFRDPWSLMVLAVMYFAITVYARREPRILKYSVGANGVTIGEKHFDYSQFHSFSVAQETGIPSVSFTPTQRFMPPVSVYFSPEDADAIVQELAKFLPNEQKDLHGIDKIMLKLRF